jgi:hypothetical protein
MTLSDSISVNTWSSAPDYERMLDIYDVALPFEMNWPRSRAMAACKEFLEVLLQQALGESAATAASAVVDSRWAPLVRQGRIKLDAVLVRHVRGS